MNDRIADPEYAQLLVNLISNAGIMDEEKLAEMAALSNRARMPLELLLQPTLARDFAGQLGELMGFVESTHGSVSTVPIVGLQVPDLDVLYLQIGDRFFRVSGASRLEHVGGIATPSQESGE